MQVPEGLRSYLEDSIRKESSPKLTRDVDRIQVRVAPGLRSYFLVIAC